MLHQYQKDRLTAFLHPSDNPRQAGLPAESVEDRDRCRPEDRPRRPGDADQLGYLPEHHTDFIFAVVGERYGFVGAALVLSLYALMIWRGLRILTLAKNLFGALVAGGIVAMLMFQVFVNVGMNDRHRADHGHPAAAHELWRQSVITTLLALGLLQSIYVQGRAAAALKGRVLTY